MASGSIGLSAHERDQVGRVDSAPAGLGDSISLNTVPGTALIAVGRS
jgi:hypothetical protein